MRHEVLGIVEDFERLWTVAGFADRFAANLACPPRATTSTDPYDIVLREHHRLLVTALRCAQRRGELGRGRGVDELADALVGFYLSRRLGRGDLEDWAGTAIATILG